MDKQTQLNLLKVVEKNYREIADDFNETRKKFLWPELAKMTEQVKIGQTVLDVGCGNGRLLENLLDKGVVYVGVDQSVELVKIAQERFAQMDKKSSTYSFYVGNIFELGQLPQYNFDYVFCIAVLHHIPGENLQIDALRQLKNKVRKGGKIIISVWNLWSQKKYVRHIIKFWFLRFFGKNKMDLGDILFDWKGKDGVTVSQRYYHAFRWSELNNVVKQAGLAIEGKYEDKFNYYLILTK